jgi:hypothetical protein
MFKKIILYTFSAILFLLFSAWLFRTVYNKIELEKEKKISYILPDSVKTLIHNGDIILRYGHGLVSDYIVNKLDEPFSISHCGIIRKNKSKLEVIHSESSSFLSKEGIQVQNLDGFTDAAHKNSVIIVRYNKCDSSELINITDKAQHYLDKEIPFDYEFNPRDTTTMFCSEIIWHVFKDAFNKDIFLNDKNETDFNQFKNFYDSSQFKIIINDQIRQTDF